MYKSICDTRKEKKRLNLAHCYIITYKYIEIFGKKRHAEANGFWYEYVAFSRRALIVEQ